MAKRLRILHVGNGRAYKIKAIVDAFLERGHEIHMVAVPAAEGTWPGVTWHRLPESSLPGPARVLARFAQIRRLARRLQPDIVHAHNAWGPGWYGAVTGVHPLVIHAYGGDLLPERYASRPALERRLTSWTCRTADRVIVTGHHMIDASAGLAFPRERLMLLPRGVDLDRYRPDLDTAALRSRLGLDGASPIVFSPRYQVDESLYNFDIVIDAFAKLRQEFPQAVCIQLFDERREAARAALERLAAERGLGSSYRMVPAVDNVTMPLFYNLADVVASVPSTDGFPVTVLEASACAAPLVVSRLPYCSEWFVDGENGLIVPVRDADALCEGLARVCRDKALGRRLGEAGQRLVAERADYRKCMDELEREYYRLIAQRRGPAALENSRMAQRPAR
jgi:glycosyltransferase involved in cell wall biosynthesis